MPMTYALNGKQYIVVGVSGGNYRGEYISLALPQTQRDDHAAAVASSTRRAGFDVLRGGTSHGVPPQSSGGARCTM